jgi:hypothetical protein
MVVSIFGNNIQCQSNSFLLEGGKQLRGPGSIMIMYKLTLTEVTTTFSLGFCKTCFPSFFLYPFNSIFTTVPIYISK